jgi:hypothetical protein
MFPYCAYPAFDYTPRVKIDSAPDEVRAFRVDMCKRATDVSPFRAPFEECLSEIPVANYDEVPAQLKPSITYGVIVLAVALNYGTHTSHSLALRLYRPGYELVEIRTWERANRVDWNPASDLNAQEQALDRLYTSNRLEKGSKSSPHRDALMFGVGEYNRLGVAADSPEQRARLANKSSKLLELAEQ